MRIDPNRLSMERCGFDSVNIQIAESEWFWNQVGFALTQFFDPFSTVRPPLG
jgi:hypothetical protein